MANDILVVVTPVSPPPQLPGTAAFGKVTLVVTDASGAVQTQSVTGVENPPYSATFTNLAAGAGSVVATCLDVNGATLGTALSQAFTTAPATGAGTFPQPGSIQVTAA